MSRGWPPGALLRATLTPYLHLDDPWVVDVVLATVVANTLDGDPLWLLVVSPPSSGKTELVQMFTTVPWCDWLSQITENTFLSGLQRRTKSGHSVTAPEHSLLFRWTDPRFRQGKPPVRVMLVQDLTGLITTRREKRDEIFGQLREIYDGRLVKRTGMGDDLTWEGYLGLLGAVTPKYDEVAELYSVLGERFVLYRPLRLDPEAEARAAVNRSDEDSEWRSLVAEVAERMVQSATRRLAGVRVPEWTKGPLIDLARLTAAGRATVAREGDSKVIRVPPEPEGPARLVQQFAKLLRGLCAARGLGQPGPDELAIVAKVARDTMPKARLVILQALADKGGTKYEVAERTGLPPSTCEYHLQELVTLGIARPGSGPAKTRALTDEYRVLIERAGFFAEVEPAGPALESRNVRGMRTGIPKGEGGGGAVGGTARDFEEPDGDLGGESGDRAEAGPVVTIREPQGAPAPLTCRICGGAVPRGDFPAHVAEHQREDTGTAGPTVTQRAQGWRGPAGRPRRAPRVTGRPTRGPLAP